MLTIPISLLFIHFVADFMCQSDWMATNKSKSVDVLTLHCLIYAVFFLPFGWRFALLTFWFHFVTDYFTSRLTSRLWFIKLEQPYSEVKSYLDDDTLLATVEGGKRHWFFVAIGADQLIHYVTLALTYHYLVG